MEGAAASSEGLRYAEYARVPTGAGKGQAELDRGLVSAAGVGRGANHPVSGSLGEGKATALPFLLLLFLLLMPHPRCPQSQDGGRSSLRFPPQTQEAVGHFHPPSTASQLRAFTPNVCEHRGCGGQAYRALRGGQEGRGVVTPCVGREHTRPSIVFPCHKEMIPVMFSPTVQVLLWMVQVLMVL